MSTSPRTPRSWFPARQTVARFATRLRRLVRSRPVADQVAEAPDRIDRFALDCREHRLERVQVRVDVRDDGDAHGARAYTGRKIQALAAMRDWLNHASRPCRTCL